MNCKGGLGRRPLWAVAVIFALIFTGTYWQLSQITRFNKKRIQNGEIRRLPELENMDKDKFDSIAANLPENECVKNYYFEIVVTARIDDADIRLMTFHEYEQNKEFLSIDMIEYNAVYYKLLTNSWKYKWKEYFKKCFTLVFNGENEFVEKYLWERRLP